MRPPWRKTKAVSAAAQGKHRVVNSAVPQENVRRSGRQLGGKHRVVTMASQGTTTCVFQFLVMCSLAWLYHVHPFYLESLTLKVRCTVLFRRSLCLRASV